MCDETILHEMEQAEGTPGMSRRGFTLLGTVAAIAACGHGGDAEAKGPALKEAMVTVRTPDGTADAFFVHPAKGKHPGIVMWPDIAGLRDAKKAMARRIAAQGFAVLVVNQYYRSAKAPIFASFAEWRTPEGQAKLKPMQALVNPEGVTRDGAAFVVWLDRQAAVDTRRGIGSNGYCMGGPFTVRTAAAVPGRVGAAASLHGGGLVNDRADSPHRLLVATKAGYLFAIARNDDARAPGDKDSLREAAAAVGRAAEVEVFQADHGWTVPDSPSYNAAEADRAFSRMMALFARL